MIIMETIMPRNVHAFTAPGVAYPEYISVNETDDPDKFTITVRSPAKKDGACGDSATITLTMVQVNLLAADMLRAITGTAV